MLERVRGAKSRAKTSMKTPVLELHAVGSAVELELLDQVADDLRNACLIGSLTTEESDAAFDVTRIELGEAPPKVART